MIKHKPTKYAIIDFGEGQTEQEHKDSCDINIMIYRANRGQQIHGGGSNTYGYDDTTMDGVQHRILKEKLERDLEITSKTQEFTEEELALMPEKVTQKYKFRKKQAPEKTNEQTKTNEIKTEPFKQTEQKT